MSLLALAITAILFFLILLVIVTAEDGSPVSDELVDEVNENLESRFTVDDPELDEVPQLEVVEQVAENYQIEEPVVKPVIGVTLDREEEPEPSVAYEYVSDVLDSVYGRFDEQVRCYEVQVGHGEGVHRIQVTSDIVEEDEGDRSLLDLVEEGDDGDPGVPPIYWEKIAEPSSGDDIAVVAAASGGAAAASVTVAGGA